MDTAADSTSLRTGSTASGTPAVEPVHFMAEGVRLQGNLFRPCGGGDDGSLPAVVVVGAWSSIVERTGDRYAAKLATRGLTALSFDFSGFGLSGGDPRNVESPGLKARDIHGALSFLASHPVVDQDRIGILAICASAGSAVLSVIDGVRARCLSLVAPWLHDAELVLKAYRGQDGTQASTSAGIATYVPSADVGDRRAAMSAWTEWLRFDPIALAPHLRAPTSLVHGNEAAIGARRFYERLTCPKPIVWVPGRQHDFYEQSSTVDRAVSHAFAHIAHHLQPVLINPPK